MAKNPSIKHLTYKIVVMGDQYCGKSSIISRYTNNRYNSTYIQTLGSEFEKRELTIDGNPIVLYIYDTMGQTEMKTITRSLYRNAQGIILVFDFSRKDTLEHIKDWISLIKDNCEVIPEMMVVGNKVDLHSEHRQVTSKQAQAMAESQALQMVEVSAKADLNIDYVFNNLTQSIYSHRKQLFPNAAITSIRLHRQPERESRCCSSS